MSKYFKISVFLLLSLGVYCAYWFLVADQIIETIYEKKIAHINGKSKIEYSNLYVKGFPFWFHVQISEPVISITKNNLTWSWRGPKSKISARPWSLDKIQINSPGQHLIIFKTKNLTRELDVNVEYLKILFRLYETSIFPARVQVEIKQALHSSEPLPGFGLKTNYIHLNLEAMGALPETIKTDDIENWRKQGGTLEVNNMLLKHGPVRIKGEGTLALNENLQPMGAFSLEVRGYMDAVDRLQSSRLILPSEARIARAILSILGTKKKLEKNYEIDEMVNLPLTVQNRYVYIGPLALGRIPIFNWPASK